MVLRELGWLQGWLRTRGGAAGWQAEECRPAGPPQRRLPTLSCPGPRWADESNTLGSSSGDHWVTASGWHPAPARHTSDCRVIRCPGHLERRRAARARRLGSRPQGPERGSLGGWPERTKSTCYSQPRLCSVASSTRTLLPPSALPTCERKAHLLSQDPLLAARGLVSPFPGHPSLSH